MKRKVHRIISNVLFLFLITSPKFLSLFYIGKCLYGRNSNTVAAAFDSLVPPDGEKGL